MEILYSDPQILVCIKPPRVNSTDIPGGLPELIRKELKDPAANIRTVHRLDQVVSGLMVLARTSRAASDLSKAIREGKFTKEYLAVIHGCPEAEQGILKDLLFRDKAEKKTIVAEDSRPGVQCAALNYKVLQKEDCLSKVEIHLITGRTHQIRAQFSSRGMPLVGDRKYGIQDLECEIALWSHKIGFPHPKTGKWMEFSREPPSVYPWILF